jgi:probable phosphomutase (TIGR03848 family)
VRANKPAVIYLLRHGHSSANAKAILAGRDFKVSLSKLGVKQSISVAGELKGRKFDSIYSSPLPRCLETLEPLVTSTNSSKIEHLDGVIEMEYGDWSGKKLVTLSRNKLWKTIQNRPSLVRFPKGESFMEMQTRAMESISSVAKPGSTILICSHGDVIKAIVSGFIGLPLDSFQRLSIEPASITILEIFEDRITLKVMNSTSHLRDEDLPDEDLQKINLGGDSGAKRR